MPTVANLVTAGVLQEYEVDLGPRELVERCIYGTSNFVSWVSNVLPTLPNDRNQDLSPLEQVEQLFYEFVIGRKLVHGQHLKKLSPLVRHVWALRTEDVRILGYFYVRGTFIAISGELKRNLTRASLYRPHIQLVCTIRDQLDLDPPKFLTEASANAVL